MTNGEAKLLPFGIYVLEWKGGGESLAAVGQLYDGSRWFAPINWTSQTRTGIASTNWYNIERVRLIVSQEDLVEVREGRATEDEDERAAHWTALTRGIGPKPKACALCGEILTPAQTVRWPDGTTVCIYGTQCKNRREKERRAEPPFVDHAPMSLIDGMLRRREERRNEVAAVSMTPRGPELTVYQHEDNCRCEWCKVHA